MHWCSWLVLGCQSVCWASVCALLTFRGLANLLVVNSSVRQVSPTTTTTTDNETVILVQNKTDGGDDATADTHNGGFVGAAALRSRTAGAVMLAVAAAMMVVPPVCLIAARYDRSRHSGTNFVIVPRNDLPPSYEEAARASRINDRVPEYWQLYGKDYMAVNQV